MLSKMFLRRDLVGKARPLNQLSNDPDETVWYPSLVRIRDSRSLRVAPARMRRQPGVSMMSSRRFTKSFGRMRLGYLL